MTDYKEDLLADLADPEYAAHYLTAAYRESRATFLVALRDVADAVFGMTKLAQNVEANRVSLYRALSDGGNPTLGTLNSIIDALNLNVSFSPRVPITPAGAAKKRRPASPNTIASKTKEVSKGSRGAGRAAARIDKRSANKSRG